MSASVPLWWHSIDLGQGVVTPGRQPADFLAARVRALQLPDLRGKTVLDIGSYDGFYAFEAERRGAARVVALDHYVWSLDLGAHIQLLARLQSAGRRAEALPRLGTFDVVFFFGVLYHMEDPLAAMRRVAAFARELAIVETEAVHLPGYEDRPLCEFFPSNELHGDVSNWWAPNEPALLGLCRAAGFARAIAAGDGPPRQPLSFAARSAAKMLLAKLPAGAGRRYALHPTRDRAVAHAVK